MNPSIDEIRDRYYKQIDSREDYSEATREKMKSAVDKVLENSEFHDGDDTDHGDNGDQSKGMGKIRDQNDDAEELGRHR